MNITTNQNIGTVKYTVSWHDPKEPKYHPDGSPFYDLRTFKNKKKRDAFIKSLKSNQ
jgi:hypothetical protein